MEQFKTIIQHFNSLSPQTMFTSRMLKDDLPDEIKGTAVNSFLDVAFKMGAVTKFKLKETIDRSRIGWVSIRQINDTEKSDLTNYPRCIDFKKELEAKIKEASGSVQVVLEPDDQVEVKTYTRRKPTKKSGTTVIVNVNI
jgi:hypothetical protein